MRGESLFVLISNGVHTCNVFIVLVLDEAIFLVNDLFFLGQVLFF